MNLWKAHLHVPFSYGGDSLIYGMAIKGTIDHGWYLDNPSVSAPGELHMHDYPLADGFNFLLIKALALVRSDYASVLNLFFLLTFPLTALTAVFALRQFNVSNLAAVVWSLVYAFLPYHFWRGESHLFIATYYPVPLLATVALWLSSGELSFTRSAGQRWSFIHSFRSRKFVFAILACLLVSSVGLGYYAFFSCFFLLVGAGIAAVSRRTLRPFVPALILIAIICAGLLANLAPSLVYLRRHGDVKVIQRAPEESEVYGLKIAPMLLPVRNHRIPKLAAVTERYRVATSSNESGSATLGIFGGAGFLLLLFWLVFQWSGSKAMGTDSLRAPLHRLSILNIAAVLLGTVGGFSALFAFIISPQIRTYNRISVFIAFFSLLAVALVLEEFFLRRSQWPVAVRYVVFALILLVALLDQTNKYFVPVYAENEAEFTNDQQFVSAIEQRMPPGAMIFQLPHVGFPESPAVNRMGDYELFKGYLHSQKLRWSYGAMKRRDTDLWLQQISAKRVPEMLEALAVAGFKGIYIDRFGFQDTGVETQIRDTLQSAPLVSANQRLVFFDLTGFSQSVLDRYSPADLERQRDRVLYPVLFRWTEGFSELEGKTEDNWRWSSNRGQLKIINTSTRAKRVEINMRLFSGHEQPANMRVEGEGFTDQLFVNNQGTSYARVFTIQPGTMTIEFSCDAERVDAPTDSRVLIFRVANFTWKEL